MIVMKTPNRFGESKPPFMDTKTGEGYSRIVGGMCWPSATPGFAIMLAELWKEDKAAGRRGYRILAESPGKNPSDLIRVTSEMAKSCLAEIVYADDHNRTMMELLQKQTYRLHLSTAPFSGEENAFETYLLTIRELTQPTRKLLNFGTSRLPGILATIRPDDIATSARHFERYPEAVTLGFAVAGLEMQRSIHARPGSWKNSRNCTACITFKRRNYVDFKTIEARRRVRKSYDESLKASLAANREAIRKNPKIEETIKRKLIKDFFLSSPKRAVSVMSRGTRRHMSM